ncbi:MAG: PDC sensor domain-containing protein [Gammaproteobacteria bacterium]|nr:PDC sensor domain-containing protein [Gammaproteobacteria bacterium]
MPLKRPSPLPFACVALLFASLSSAPLFATSGEEARQLVNAKARVLFMKHRRAIKALESTLRNPAYKAFFSSPDPERRATHREEIAQTTLKVQRYFDVEEMCLIDRDGNELVRMVAGALDPHLSTDEEHNVFFEPAFALPEGDVLVSPVYRSPDSGEWVLAYVTPIALQEENVALLHYEQKLTGVADDLVDGLDPSTQALLAFDEEARVLFDSRDPELPPPGGGALPTMRDGLGLEAFVRAAEREEAVDGARVAVRKVRGWTLVALHR